MIKSDKTKLIANLVRMQSCVKKKKRICQMDKRLTSAIGIKTDFDRNTNSLKFSS